MPEPGKPESPFPCPSTPTDSEELRRAEDAEHTIKQEVAYRAETAEDAPAIFAIHQAAFGRDKEARLVAALTERPGFDPRLSLLALAGGKPVGHILLSPVNLRTESGGEHQSLALAPLAVLPEFQGKGVGSSLVRGGLEAACEMGWESVFVVGNPDYYGRFGFLPASRHGIGNNLGIPSRVFMDIELVPGSLEGASGTLEYPEEFRNV